MLTDRLLHAAWRRGAGAAVRTSRPDYPNPNPEAQPGPHTGAEDRHIRSRRTDEVDGSDDDKDDKDYDDDDDDNSSGDGSNNGDDNDSSSDRGGVDDGSASTGRESGGAELAGFAYHARYMVLACEACRHCMVPGLGVKRHLADHHQAWSLARRQRVAAYAASLPLAPPTLVHSRSGPLAGRTPLRGLTVYEGWRCRQCQFQCLSEMMMQAHHRRAHGWKRSTGRVWEAAALQTFFSGPYRRYFEVCRETHAQRQGRAGDALGLAVDWLLEASERTEAEAAQAAARVPDDVSPADSSPWLRNTRWARQFAGRDLGAIVAAAARPGGDETGLRCVWESVERVLARCRTGVTQWHDEEADGDVALSWLASPQIDRCSQRPFSVYQEGATHQRYVATWARLLCYCLRLIHAEDQNGHVFSAREEQALRQVWEQLELEQADEEALDQCVFDLSVALWTHEARARSQSAVIHFTAVLGISRDRGCFLEPSAYSP